MGSLFLLEVLITIPHLGTNLVSLGALYCQGVSVKSFDNGLVLSKNSKELFRAFLTGSTDTLYHIQCMSLASNTAYLSETSGSMYLWHHYIEHLSSCAISSICYQNLIKSLDINTPQDFDHLYSGCANRKLHCSSFSESSNNQYSRIELVVMDLTSPISIPTWDEFLYALVIVEVSCCYPVGRLLHTKEDTGVAIYNILAILERQSGLKICYL